MENTSQQIEELETLGDLLRALTNLSAEQLKQPIQCLLSTSNEDDVQEMITGIALGTVAQFEFYKCRSTHNNKYCPDDVILLLDHNPFAEDGAIAYNWSSESVNLCDNPIYGIEGKTNPIDQKSLTAINHEDEPRHIISSVKHRIKKDRK